MNTYSDAESFVSAALSKVIKINNICDNTHLDDCGINASYVTLNGIASSMPTTLAELNTKITSMSVSTDQPYSHSQDNTPAVAFETQNGESIILFYNPLCQGDMAETSWFYVQPKVCVNMIYDLNGSKGPNTVGKDIGFITVLHPSDSNIVAPLPHVSDVGSNVYQENAAATCSRSDNEYRIPNADELTAMFINQNLLGMEDGFYWSSTRVTSTTAWRQNFITGVRADHVITGLGSSVRCVKR